MAKITKTKVAPSSVSTVEKLEKVFSPCKLKLNSKLGLGYDMTIEIINPLSNRDKRLVTGKKLRISLFSLPTKKLKVSIDREKVEKWQKSNLPLMVICENAGDLNYLWFNDNFYAKLRAIYTDKWMGMNTVEIPLDNFTPLTKGEVAVIESYLGAYNSISSKRTPMPKGTFFEIRKELKNELESFLKYLEVNGINHSELRFDELLNRTENSIYTIALVGPSRTGKSTLINALMKQEISPVNVLPTTGVPFTIQPGKTSSAEVLFNNGTVKKGNADVKFLEKYVDQKYNFANKENVKLVTVYLVNEHLEKGLAYCDVPGLDDVNDETRRISKIAVLSSNAIIYLIDVSSYKFGGFSINSHHLNDLRDLAPRMDRVYLVFNKVDILTAKELNDIKKYIERVLEENDLKKILPNDPIYISAKNSFAAINKKGKKKIPYDISHLEDALWANLLKTNKNGLQTLGGLTYEFKDELTKLSKILGSRLMESEESERLKIDLTRVKSQLINLSGVGERNRQQLLGWLKQYIGESVKERLSNLESELDSINSDVPLPSNTAIRQYLETQAYSILTEVYDEVNYKLDNLYNDLNFWVKQELSQVEFLAEAGYDPMRDKSTIDHIISPIRDSFSKGIPAALNLLEEIFSAIGDFFSGVSTFFERIFLGKTGVRKKQIKNLMVKAKTSYDKVFNKTYTDFNRHINDQCTAMITQLRDRTEVYIGQINKELAKIKTPPNAQMVSKINLCLSEIEARKINSDRIRNCLQEYTNTPPERHN